MPILATTRSRPALAAAGAALVLVAVGVPLVLTGAGVAGAVDTPDGRHLIAATDQRDHEIVIYHADRDWSKPSAVYARWRPTRGAGYTAAELAGWSKPTDAKRRTVGGRELIAVTDSHGLLSVADLRDGRKVWAVRVPAANNPHGIEVLPDGRVAAAASNSGRPGAWVRVYSVRTSRYASLELDSAHEVLWDPDSKRLWALGESELVAYRVGGTLDRPALTRDAGYQLPADSRGGHDLEAVFGYPDRLWVSTHRGLLVFSKKAGGFIDHPQLGRMNAGQIKAVGSRPGTDQVLRVRPRKVEGGLPAGYTCTWCTDTVRLFGPDATRTDPGRYFYKARFWVSRYQ